MFKSMVNVLVAITFMFSNCVWATELPADKMAVPTQMGSFAGMPLEAVGKLFAGAEVMRELGIRTESDVVQNLDKLTERGVICFARSDDAGNSAQYVFIHDGVFLRITDEGTEVNDDFYTKLLKEEGVRKTEGGKVYELCFVTDENVKVISAILSSIKSDWSVSPRQTRKPQGESIDRSRKQSHLFPKYLHEAIEFALRANNISEDRIQRILIEGASYYNKDAKEIVKPRENELEIIAVVLTQELKVKKEKDGTITSAMVGEVLLMHERLHEIIAKENIKIASLLESLMAYYEGDKAKLDTLLCSFARNYKYLPEKDLANNEYVDLTEREQLMLIEEMLVHEHIERHFFRQPVRIIDKNGARIDLEPDIEAIFFRGKRAPEELGLEPKEVVHLFAGILDINEDKMKDYFLLLYELYINYLVGNVTHLEIGRNFRPSALLTDDERKENLGVIEYKELLRERGKYRDMARGVKLILNPMDGGTGDAVVRQTYLKELEKAGIPVNVGKYGAKGADMHIPLSDNPKDKISIMEAKLLRAIQDAKAGIYGFIEYHMLGSGESAESFEKILGFKCRMPHAEEGETYRQYIERHSEIMGVLPAQLGIKVPAADAKTRCLTTGNLGHGNHGIRGTYFFQEAPGHTFEDGKTHIRVIYNGDGINNGVDPEIVGYMASEKVPVIMVTTTKTDLDKKGGQIGIQIIDEGSGRYNVQIMELAQAKAVGEGQQRLFYDMGLKSGSYIKDNQPGKQYFNTNTVLMNISVLQPLLKELISLIGPDEFRKAMTPVLIANTKKSGGKTYFQLEGALGSVVLGLAGYLNGNEDERIKQLLERHGIGKFLQIVNIDEDNRNRFFTPFKETSDFWFLFSSGRFDFEESRMELLDRYSGPMPRFELENTYDNLDKKLQYYSDVSKLETAFAGIDITGLSTLEIPGRPVLLNESILKGRVTIFNIAKHGYTDTEIVKAANTPVALENIKDKIKGRCGIHEQDGRLVLENVCILIGDTEVFVSEIKEADGDLSANYFARQIYRLIDEGEEVPDTHILVTVTEKLHQKFDLKPMEEELPELRTDAEVKNYVKSLKVFPHPKYGGDGRARHFDGISAICRLPRESLLGKKALELTNEIDKSQKDRRRGRFIAKVAHGKEQITVFNGIAMHNWKKRYENELNNETKGEIETRKKALESETDVEEETALKQAIYEVVSKRIAEALKEFSVWKRPVFKPHRVVLFPPDQSMGKTHLAITMVPATAEDMAILTKMRDVIREKTGIEDHIDFKRHITIGYFVDTLEDLEEYEEFKKMMEGMNEKVKAISEDESYWFELPDIELCFYTDMENFAPLRTFSWIDKSHNQVAGTVFGRELADRIRRIQTTRRPKAVSVGKKPREEVKESVVLYEGGLRNGELTAIAEHRHEKSGKIDLGLLGSVLEELGRVYGKGIFAVVDNIWIVDNMPAYPARCAISEEAVPYAMMVERDGKHIILLDIDVFDSRELLYIVLEHELKESIMTIIPYANEATRELTANYMSLKSALERGITIEKEKLEDLGADLQFFEALQVLQALKDAGEEVTDEKILAVAIEHMRSMRGMSYYRELFRQFPFAADWQKAIGEVGEAKARYETALRIFNDIAEAKAIAAKAKTLEEQEIVVRGKLTSVAGIEVPESIAGVTKKLKMLVSSLVVREMGMVQELLDTGKFVRLNIDELRNNAEVVDWLREVLKDVIRGAKPSPFVFYSSRGQDVGQFLEDKFGCKDAFIEAGKKIEGLGAANVITVVDLERVNWDIESKETMYMPLFYSVTSIYLASQIVITNGNVSQIRDSLVRNTIELLYKSLLGDMVEQEGWDWVRLFIEPWNVLPPIISITDTLNALREAVAKIEVAA